MKDASPEVNSEAHACPQLVDWGRGASRKMHARSWPRPNKSRGISCVAESKRMCLTVALGDYTIQRVGSLKSEILVAGKGIGD